MIEELKLFPTADGKPDVKVAWDLYNEALTFDDNFNLNDIVEANENFYCGKQWEGVQLNGLPHPTFNFIKRVTGYVVSVLNSDKIETYASRQASAGTEEEEYSQRMVDVVNSELQSLHERTEFPALMREFTRNAAVDGDACIYSYFDPTVHTGLFNGGTEVMGTIRKEIIENDRVHFGNPQDRHVEGQPWIMITSRELLRDVKKRAKENGSPDWRDILPDEDQRRTDKKTWQTSNKVTTLLLMWMDDETNTVWAYECTQTGEIKKPTDLGYHDYPIVWFCWDNVRDSYHGQALVTGLIPNQISQNKLWALTELQATKGVFGKIAYDATRIKQWDNRVGGAIPVQGGDINNVAKVIEGIPLNPQIFQLLQLQQEMTEQSMGATQVALGKVA